MQQTITNKLAILGTAIAVAFGLTFTSLAYEGLTIDIVVGDDSTEVTVKYNDVEKTYVYESIVASEVYEDLVEDLNEEDEFSFEPPITKEDVQNASGTVASDDEEAGEDETVVDGKKENKGKNIAKDAKAKVAEKANFCERTSKAAGWGVAKKCVDNENFIINDKLADKVERFAEREDRFKDFGKTTDRAELQNQLRQLLLVLIELLQQQQKALEAAGS